MIKDHEIENRDGNPAKKNGQTSTLLQALEERLALAAALAPQGEDLHCAKCFTRGRDAAIRLIRGAAQP